MNTIIEKYGKGRVFIICYVIFSVLLIAETIFLHNIYNTLNYKENKFKVQEVEDNRIIMTDGDKNKLTMLIDEELYGFDMNCEITYLTETIKYSYEFASDHGGIYIFSDGSMIASPSVEIIIENSDPNENLTSLQLEEKVLMDKIKDFHYNYVKTGVFVVYTLGGLLILLLVHGNFFYPEFFWSIQHFLSVQGGEPTEFYIFMNKLSSIIVAVVVYMGLYTILFS